ncbi:MAG: SprT-like domain-containing protein [Sedimenticola sp.]
MKLQKDRLESRVIKETRRRLKLAAKHFGQSMLAVEIRFDLTGRAAGMVIFHVGGRPVIRYNRVLLSENPEPFIQQTPPHEAAHLVARTIYGGKIKPHGEEWRSVMTLFGIDPKRCHQFDTSRSGGRRMRRFTYHCGCTTHQLTSIRHRRVIEGRIYLCRACGEALKE